MSFLNTQLARISTTANGLSCVWYSYKNASDTLATIKTSGYFNTAITDLTNGVGKFKIGDIIHAQGSDLYGLLRVTSVTTAVTVVPFQISAILDGIIEHADLGDNIVQAHNIYHNAEDAAELDDALKLIPVRSTGAYGYFLKIDGSDQMSGTTAQKTYAVDVSVSRPVGSIATGDSNDSVFKATYSNYAPNDANFIMRCYNGSTRNRSGGTLGRLDNTFGSKNDSGGTCPIVLGAQFVPENYGTVATEFGGAEALLKNESNAATLTYAYKARNADLSSQTAIQHGLLINSATLTSAGAPYTSNGFTNAITVQQACVNFANFDDATGTCATETGTEPGTWLGRIKVIMPSGTAGYIKVWSVSNA